MHCKNQFQKHSILSLQTAVVRALFERVRAGFKKSAWQEKGSWMNHMKLLFGPISMFSDEIWRSLASNQQVCCCLTEQP